MLTDQIWKCQTYMIAEAINQDVPTFVYEFDHIPGYTEGPCYQVAHSYEIPFIYPLINKRIDYVFTPSEATLSRQMRTYWESFALKNDTGAGWPQWKDDTTYVKFDVPPPLGNGITTSKDWRSKQCAFWVKNFVPPNWHP